MKTFINYCKSIYTQFKFGAAKKNKNGDICFTIFGLQAHNIAMLEPALQTLITKANAVEGYEANYTPPQQSKAKDGLGMIYFGPKNTKDASDLDVFLD